MRPVPLLAVPLALSSLVAAQSVDTLTLVVGGDSFLPGCTTYAPPPPVGAFYGPKGVFVPVLALGPCGVAGDVRNQAAAAAPLVDSMAHSLGWNGNALNGSTDVRAEYGVLAARARCTYAGYTSAITVKGAEGHARFADGLTFSSPSVAGGQSGSLRVLATVWGSLSATGNGVADVELFYLGPQGPAFLFRSQVSGGAQPVLFSATSNGLGGFVQATGSLSGSGVVDTPPIPIVFGQPLAFELGLLAFGLPGTDSDLTSDWHAVVTGFRVFGPQGQELFDFSVQSSSGRPYGAGGAQAAVAYCTPGTSASGCAATLSATGTPSASAVNGFVVSATNVEGQKDGLFFFGVNGRQAVSVGPFPCTSFRCVVPPVKRGGLLPAGGALNTCSGFFAQDLNGLWCPTCPKPGHNPGAGSVVQLQLWYRDPANACAGPSGTTSFSNALEFTVLP